MWLVDHLDVPSDHERKPLARSCHNTSLRLFQDLVKAKKGYTLGKAKSQFFRGHEKGKSVPAPSSIIRVAPSGQMAMKIFAPRK